MKCLGRFESSWLDGSLRMAPPLDYKSGWPATGFTPNESPLGGLTD